jgi:NAD(P)H-nitrite reductase large subunit
MGTSLFAVGDTGKDLDQLYRSIENHDKAKDIYEKLYFIDNRFCGGILIGDVTKGPRLLQAYQNQESVESLQS